MMSSMSPYDKRDPAGMTCKSLEAQKKRGPKPGPRKLNSKQIRYCVERSQGKTQGESYAIAFRDQGSAYMNGKLGNMKERNPKIKAHIAELIQARSDVVNIAVRDAAKELAIDKKSVLLDLMINRDLARKKNDIAAANRAVELMGREIGMFVTRIEVDRKQTLDEFLDALDLPKEDYKRIESKPQEPAATILQ